SLLIKSAIVSEDKYESGKRKILNFGHTIGHAVESYSLESGQSLFHGEAIALGMICESYISCQKNLLSSNALKEINSLIRSVFKDRIMIDIDPDRIIEFCMKDKKNYSGTMNFSLLNGIGSCLYDQEIDKEIIIDAINIMGKYER
ncbi:MAG: 3-dehydroquinate synthase, partial [Bacteroidia bacterium]|nr:3-dehydroquinate synthase [Bacteroidia bacterium]